MDEDVDDQESAALAASVAAAKDTAARSGALLSSAKEDLTDHQRWLRAQSDAVKRDRDRHERWLQRQQDLRAANAKKDRVRRHRRLVRQRALQAIRDALVDLYVFFRSWIVLGATKITGAVRFFSRSIARGAVVVWQGLAHAAGSAFRHIGSGLSAVARVLAHTFAAAGRGLAQAGQSTGQKVGLAARGAGAGVAAGAAWSGSKAKASVRAGSQALAAGSLVVAAEAGKLSRKTGQAIGSGGSAIGGGLSSGGDSAAALAAATRNGLASGASAAAAKAAKLGATSGRSLSRASAWTASRAASIPSKLFIHLARVGREVQHFARVRAPAPRWPGLPPLPGQAGGGEGAAEFQNEEAPDAAHTASVHLFETYGPHPEGTKLFGQPANDPWVPEAKPAEVPDGTAPAEAQARDVEGRTAAAAALAGLGSGVAARTGDVLSSWGQSANVRASGLAREVRRKAGAGSVWLRRQAARGMASAQAGAGAVARVQAGAVAQARSGTKEGAGSQSDDDSAGALVARPWRPSDRRRFLLRSTSDPVLAAEPGDETFSKISWAFHHPDLPLPERSVFTLSGTPEAFLINGISIAGVNNSDEALTDLEGALSSDVQRPDLLLDVVVEAEGKEPSARGPVATVPPGEPFRLTFLFPPESTGSADGISVDEFFESYGGLLLKLRYDADGAERSVIQYLDPEMLKAQLDEVSAEAGGS
ncbi:hypothetical protein AUC70_07870 [Methyloceanibacter stevinii]|uniref:Uncharacterized protein n=1 Tax=Methyloceanibacter stevinii TaxID=1774970 RepID=A0A1E3VNL9_9HYPH|nr:hypothetical protein AUC70_07870 [Methyloceanibacter stevinii]